MESQARYITRPVLAMDALEKHDDGRLVLKTPPDPRTGATSIEPDALEWIHRITSHIPDPGRHCQRFYGAYSNRGRISAADRQGQSAGMPAAKLPEQDNPDVSKEARSTWARLIRKIFEADPRCAYAAAACALFPLLRIPGSSTASCGIVKAGAAKLRILSRRGRRPMQRQQWFKNADGTAGVRLAGRHLVGEGVSGCAPNASPARAAHSTGRDWTRSPARLRLISPSNPCQCCLPP